MPIHPDKATLEQYIWSGGPTKATTNCANSRCSKKIVNGDDFFVDSLEAATYCIQCGQCLRFHRKKAGQRGEALPATFTQVEERSQ